MAVSIPHEHEHERAEAMTVSVEARPAPAKVTGVSDKRAAWSTGPGCGARGRRGLGLLKSRMQFDWMKIQ